MTFCCLCLEAESDDETSSKENIPICKKCAADRNKSRAVAKSGEFLDRTPSALCTRCGACCFMLSAVVTKKEVRRLSKWCGLLPTQIARVEEKGRNEGKLVFHRPCVFLMGKPFNYVSCRAYLARRPAVCPEYLCKIAIQYRAGICSLSEGLFLLREAFNKADPTIFNWTSDDRDEDWFMIRTAAEHARKKLREEKIPEPVIDIMIADVILPNYQLKGPVQETVMRAILRCAEADEINPLLFWDIGDLAQFSEKEYDAMVTMQRRIFHRLRDLYSVDPVKKRSIHDSCDDTDDDLDGDDEEKGDG